MKKKWSSTKSIDMQHDQQQLTKNSSEIKISSEYHREVSSLLRLIMNLMKQQKINAMKIKKIQIERKEIKCKKGSLVLLFNNLQNNVFQYKDLLIVDDYIFCVDAAQLMFNNLGIARIEPKLHYKYWREELQVICNYIQHRNAWYEWILNYQNLIIICLTNSEQNGSSNLSEWSWNEHQIKYIRCRIQRLLCKTTLSQQYERNCQQIFVLIINIINQIIRQMFFCCGKKKKDRKSLGNLQQLNLICQDGLYFDKNLKIITEYNKTNYSENMKGDCRYYCPICFKYYDCMLQSTCCNNYVCHVCAVQSLTNKMYNCHYCRNEHCKYVDVDPTQQLKIYTDSHRKL